MAWKVFLAQAVLFSPILADIVDFNQIGAIPDDFSDRAAWHNGILLNHTFTELEAGDTLLFPNMTFHMMGGVQGWNLTDVTIRLEGTIRFSDNMEDWPRGEMGVIGEGSVLHCWAFFNLTNVTFTSNGRGTLDGAGDAWWGIPGIGYLQRGKDRPHLFYVHGERDSENLLGSRNLLLENWLFLDSPHFTVNVKQVDTLEIRNCEVSARRTEDDHHGVIDMTAFNTDGFDVSGKNVWIHDCQIWNQDDCISVGDDSEHMLFERINASGIGLVIGSISHNTVNNITFRDSYMHHTWKGLYLKFRKAGGVISNVLYENIILDAPEQWAVWIGPAQQSVSSSLCNPHPCSLCWPELASYGAECNMPASEFHNITFRNITIRDPQYSYGMGVIMGSEELPMTNIIFDGVRVVGAEADESRANYYTCSGVETGEARGDTWPVPPCFVDNTEGGAPQPTR